MVIGLDGVPYWLLRDLADRGVMPKTAGLLPQGSLRAMSAPVPDISSTSWASFLTGTDPGTHGIYGFVDLQPGTYRTYFPNYGDLKAPPLWEAVDRSGGRSVIMNVPSTYPAPPLRGTLVSGFVAPDFDRAVYPPELREPLRALDYQLDVEVGDVAGDPDGFLDRVDAALAARRAAFAQVLSDDWDLAVCVITETDRVHHFLWSSLIDPTARLHPRILDFYRRVDEAVAELADRAGDGALFIASDHGFGPADTQFYLNAWLRQAGYLALAPGAESLEEIDERTLAFALDPGRIYFNTADRFPRGGRPADPEEIGARLLALRLTEDGRIVEGGAGRPVVAEVLSGPRTYRGPYAGDAPDLVVMPAAGVQIRGAWATDRVVGTAPLTGTHTRSDATFWCRGDQGTEPLHMRDVAPSVLASLGIDPPPGTEGTDMRSMRPRSEEDVRC
ncbi:alkaline phosphatase family protein [Streptomyces sp. NRRL S-350]|uniref:alkaline phosphatase family protein n=1 Tax=Streptomyces sp. NRRL S-350 TaxID=1463902 RepID=UPI001F39BB16|nr:alkaline phosphatase family protein [Streptomyces sp. NRRL S-350]